MEILKKHYSVQMMCDVLAVPRSTYYHSLQKTESTRERENHAITMKIIQIHQESKERYGAPKIHQTLLKSGLSVSLKRVKRPHDKSKNPFDNQEKIPSVLQPRKSDGTQEPF